MVFCFVPLGTFLDLATGAHYFTKHFFYFSQVHILIYSLRGTDFLLNYKSLVHFFSVQILSPVLIRCCFTT